MANMIGSTLCQRQKLIGLHSHHLTFPPKSDLLLPSLCIRFGANIIHSRARGFRQTPQVIRVEQIVSSVRIPRLAQDLAAGSKGVRQGMVDEAYPPYAHSFAATERTCGLAPAHVSFASRSDMAEKRIITGRARARLERKWIFRFWSRAAPSRIL